MDWVSFDEIKQKVTLRMAIERYGIPLRKVGSHILRGKCPLPTHQSKGNNQTFIATLTKGTGGAWSCHSDSCAANRGGKKGGNVLDFVAAMERCSVRDAAIKLQLWFLVPAAGGGSVPSHHEPPPATPGGHEPEGGQLISKESREGETGENKPLTFTLKSVDPTHLYLRERGITEATAREFGVGFFPGKGSMQNRLVIPIHNAKGELVAYAGRSIDGTEPRYKFPPGFHKSLELYNLHRVIGEPSVVLVEGYFDCMKVTQAGYPCIALMGSTMSKAQEKLITDHFGHVVVMLDGDDAGRRGTEDVADRLQRVIFQVKTIELDPGMQPDQLREDEISKELEGIIVGSGRGREVV